ncbi:MAG: response regulator [Christensenellales bacterium]|jgi:DNA-binding NarL/FixJ family response regulator
MRVVVVDDDALVRQSLKIILQAQGDVQVVGEGANGAEARALFLRLRPDVLLMDIRMQPESGLTACQAILQEDPQARILFLTTFLDDVYIVQALRLGAKGYILKQHFESILPAVRAVYLGQRVFGDEVADKLPALMVSPNGYDYAAHDIGPRELDIIREVAEGLSNREIAQKLFLSEGTVRNYLSAILEKLNLRDRTQLAIFYLNHSG